MFQVKHIFGIPDNPVSVSKNVLNKECCPVADLPVKNKQKVLPGDQQSMTLT